MILLDPLALIIVFGGTALAAILRTPAGELARAVRALKMLPRRAFSADPLLAQVSALSRIAQRCGVVTLDRSVITDPDLAAAIAAIVDGASAEQVEAIVLQRREARAERHAIAAEVWAAAAEAAPAMGMVGTLVGLAQMFASMADDAAIGAAMGVALLATLYGALLANLVLMPIAARLRAAARAEAFQRARLRAPLMELARRETPRHRLASAA